MRSAGGTGEGVTGGGVAPIFTTNNQLQPAVIGDNVTIDCSLSDYGDPVALFTLIREDIMLVAQQANVSQEATNNALIEAKGDLARAILLLTIK